MRGRVLEGLQRFLCRFSQEISFTIVCVLGAWLAYNVYGTLHRITQLYVTVPVGDYFRIPQFLHDYQTFHIARLWQQHNEHRIIFPELFFATDVLVASGKEILPLIASFLFYAATWGVLSFTIWRDDQIQFFHKLTATLLTGVFAFWQGCALSLAQPFLLQWPIMEFGVAVSLVYLKKSADSGRIAHLVVGITAAAVATYSSANALLLWPLLLLIALAIRLQKKLFAILLISALVFEGLFFVGYQFSQDANFLRLVKHPIDFLQFAGSYLSMPLGPMKSVGFGIILGLTGLAGMMFLISVAWRKQLLLSTLPGVVLSGYYAFTLLTLTITAAGRMNLAKDPYLEQARAIRYLTVPTLTWVAVFLFLVWLSARLKWRGLSTRRLVVLLALFFALSFRKLRAWQEVYSREFADDQWAALSIENGLLDSEIIGRIFPSPEFLHQYLPEYKRQRLSTFHDDPEKWIGHKLRDFSKIRPNKIAGGIAYTYPVEGGVQVVGWVNADDGRDPYPRIIIGNEQGVIAGFGRRPNAAFPQELHTLKTPENESWVAFANLRVPSNRLTAYAVTRHGLEAIEGDVPVPAIEAAAADEVGPPIKDIVWHMNDAWAPGRLEYSPRYSWVPSVPPYGTWLLHGEKAGQITADFAAPSNGCVILPIMHGVAASREAAQLIDADTGRVLGDVPFRDWDLFWSVWRVKFDPSVKRLRFVGNSIGVLPAEWLAVSAPLECRPKP